MKKTQGRPPVQKRASSVRKALRRARLEGTAIAAFNVPGMDVMRAATSAARANNRPVIIQISQSVLREAGIELIMGSFDLAKAISGAEAYLHLDHCSDKTLILACIDAGWDMVMYDGSHLPFRENLKFTIEIVTRAHDQGVAVEAELGGIGGNEDGAAGGLAVANIEEIPEFVECSGIDCLAVGFGNAHGHYETRTKLRWEILNQAGKLCDIPLVLHGGTGLNHSEFRKAIGFGCAKVNISTALKDVYVETVGDSLLLNAIAKAPMELHKQLFSRCRTACSGFIELFAES